MLRPPLAIHVIPCLDSNYTFLLRDEETGTTGVVDPGEAAPVAAELGRQGWKLDWILLTHHHDDHIAGVAELRDSGVQVAGGAPDRSRLPALDVELSPGDRWNFGSCPVRVLDVSGHTVGQIALHFPEESAIFAGDAIFVMGCGRVFEGTALQAWQALSQIASLPPETRIYCGHEMAAANAAFCLSVDAGHEPSMVRAERIQALREAGQPIMPTTVGEELKTNIFLRAGEAQVAAAVGLAGADPAAVFAEIRRRKDAA